MLGNPIDPSTWRFLVVLPLAIPLFFVGLGLAAIELTCHTLVNLIDYWFTWIEAWTMPSEAQP